MVFASFFVAVVFAAWFYGGGVLIYADVALCF
jgi:hypothetical protein